MSPAIIFRDRTDAGEQLAQEICQILPANNVVRPIVYALPRGGLPVALPVARRLGCPLDVVVAKKIGHPQNPELAIGAVTADGKAFWAEQTPLHLRHSPQGKAALLAACDKAKLQLAQFHSGRPPLNPKGAIAILIDDGIATGMTMAVAAQALREQNPSAIWLCAPVAPSALLPWLQQWGDRIFLLTAPKSFSSVSRFYGEFPQVEIDEALACLHQQKEWLMANG